MRQDTFQRGNRRSVVSQMVSIVAGRRYLVEMTQTGKVHAFTKTQFAPNKKAALALARGWVK